MRTGTPGALLRVAALAFVIGGNASAQEAPAPAPNPTGDSATASSSGWLEGDGLTGDWDGGRAWLKAHGITIKPRLTQFYQGLPSGDGDHSFEYGGKADLWFNADLGKLGLWSGFSITVHAEQNFGNTVNVRGGNLSPPNAALFFPGMSGPNAFDLSSLYLTQKFGDSVSLVAGKLNMIDIAASKPFMGGAGIDSFWNITFVAPPSGTVPPYLFGALLSVQTKPATFGLWVYDPNSVVNKTGFEQPFSNGITYRGNVDFPVSIFELSGHQGIVALYSNERGNNLQDVGLNFPPGEPSTKNHRYYFAYTFDQYLYQSKKNPKEGFGLFGQFGISDGNPNKLYYSGLGGLGGTGLVAGRSRDNWGAGYYYDVMSPYLQQSLLQPVKLFRPEQGVDMYYNFAMTPWLNLGADLQIIRPSFTNQTAIFTGLRAVIKL